MILPGRTKLILNIATLFRFRPNKIDIRFDSVLQYQTKLDISNISTQKCKPKLFSELRAPKTSMLPKFGFRRGGLFVSIRKTPMTYDTQKQN